MSTTKERQRAEKERQNEIEQSKRDLTALMDTEGGRRVMCRLLTDAGLYTTTFVPGDPHATSFKEGARNNGLRLLNELLAITPNQYQLMMKEDGERRQALETLKQKQSNDTED